LRVITLLLHAYVPKAAEALLAALAEESREIAAFGSRGGGQRSERIEPLFPKLG
jgi:methionyl-tRNA synthetase